MNNLTQSKNMTFLQYITSLYNRFNCKGGGEQNDVKSALEEVLEEHDGEGEEGEKILSSDEKDMLRNVLSIGDVTVSDVMVPRSDIASVDNEITLSELKDSFNCERHTRMPVYGENLDDLKGFIHLKDLVPALSGDEPFDIDAILRKVMFVSPSMKVVDLIVQMRMAAEHLAIVVDEYGGTDGLVTLEDLFEEIVGEIQDEHDEEETEIEFRRMSPTICQIDARYRLDDLEDELGISLTQNEDEQDADTIGGLIFIRLGRVPARGEILEINGVARLEVLSADPRKIRKVKLYLL